MKINSVDYHGSDFSSTKFTPAVPIISPDTWVFTNNQLVSGESVAAADSFALFVGLTNSLTVLNGNAPCYFKSGAFSATVGSASAAATLTNGYPRLRRRPICPAHRSHWRLLRFSLQHGVWRS